MEREEDDFILIDVRPGLDEEAEGSAQIGVGVGEGGAEDEQRRADAVMADDSEDDDDSYEMVELLLPTNLVQLIAYLKMLAMIEGDRERVGGDAARLQLSLADWARKGGTPVAQIALLLAEPFAFQYVIHSLGVWKICLGLTHTQLADFFYRQGARDAAEYVTGISPYLPGLEHILERLAGGVARGEFYRYIEYYLAGMNHFAPTVYLTGKGFSTSLLESRNSEDE